jgi:hypothetical protein
MRKRRNRLFREDLRQRNAKRSQHTGEFGGANDGAAALFRGEAHDDRLAAFETGLKHVVL